MDRRRTAEPLTIDGEAVVLARTIGLWDLSETPPAPGEAAWGPAPTPEPAQPPPFAAQPARRRAADLLFDPAPRYFTAAPPPAAWRRFHRARAAQVAAAATLALAALPVATYAVAPRGAEPPRGVELVEATARVVPHRGGAVLSVEGRLRNASATAAGLPAVRVHVGGVRPVERAFRLDRAGPLAPGDALAFHSTLALPSATTGPIEVALEATPSGRASRMR